MPTILQGSKKSLRARSANFCQKTQEVGTILAKHLSYTQTEMDAQSAFILICGLPQRQLLFLAHKQRQDKVATCPLPSVSEWLAPVSCLPPLVTPCQGRDKPKCIMGCPKQDEGSRRGFLFLHLLLKVRKVLHFAQEPFGLGKVICNYKTRTSLNKVTGLPKPPGKPTLGS